MLNERITAMIADESARLADELRRSVVQVKSRAGGGSGIIWRSDGKVVTNHHVTPQDHVEIETLAGDRFSGRVVDRDPGNDLAAIQLEGMADELPAARPGDSRSLRVGQLVLAIGNPFGDRGAVTAGIISAVREDSDRRELVQADIQLRPGNSGGPLLDSAGAVVGVNAMIASPGVALAVPVHVVERFLGPVAPRIGIAGREVALETNVAERAGLADPHGVIVLEVASGGPAEQAGILPGDVVVGLNDQPVRRATELAGRLARRDPRSALRLRVLRAGAIRDVAVPAVEA